MRQAGAPERILKHGGGPVGGYRAGCRPSSPERVQAGMAAGVWWVKLRAHHSHTCFWPQAVLTTGPGGVGAVVLLSDLPGIREDKKWYLTGIPAVSFLSLLSLHAACCHCFYQLVLMLHY